MGRTAIWSVSREDGAADEGGGDGGKGVVCAVAVGAFNLSLVRGCAHYCKLNSHGNLRRVTAGSATVICPRRERVYTYGTPCLVKNGRETRCPSSWMRDLWLPRCDTLRSLPEVINLAKYVTRYLSITADHYLFRVTEPRDHHFIVAMVSCN